MKTLLKRLLTRQPRLRRTTLVNVRYDEEVSTRRVLRRISVGPHERLRTASERLAMLDEHPVRLEREEILLPALRLAQQAQRLPLARLQPVTAKEMQAPEAQAGPGYGDRGLFAADPGA